MRGRSLVHVAGPDDEYRLSDQTFNGVTCNQLPGTAPVEKLTTAITAERSTSVLNVKRMLYGSLAASDSCVHTYTTRCRVLAREKLCNFPQTANDPRFCKIFWFVPQL